jgi:hypothetical protein
MDGIYTDGVGVTHGFFRNANGALRFRSISRLQPHLLEGINDQRWMSGRYTGSDGIVHGFLLIPPSTFVSFDYPDARSRLHSTESTTSEFFLAVILMTSVCATLPRARESGGRLSWTA